MNSTYLLIFILVTLIWVFIVFNYTNVVIIVHFLFNLILLKTNYFKVILLNLNLVWRFILEKNGTNKSCVVYYIDLLPMFTSRLIISNYSCINTLLFKLIECYDNSKQRQ